MLRLNHGLYENLSTMGGHMTALLSDTTHSCIRNLQKKNRIDAETALYKLLVGGRKKHKNVILVGESNYAKTFLVQPFSIVFARTFNTPSSSTTFSWLDADTAQVIMLNDY